MKLTCGLLLFGSSLKLIMEAEAEAEAIRVSRH